ncbi:MAG: transcription-repair coupling factor [Gemmatimonadetes bacterium]|jgi:transcription-repair coupling factor (superfamily II helicase)|nr:transcription-repair coupling factor [Gemmatimonadota bacterium]MBK7594296.1 transcription-repair coupling factor [Gemmatimonadota bacterium]MBK9548883.1 transcription-repair coupling factor [Gemmatimonadota bacterium]MBP6444476.1 transcription-repair coupling factor [Gemmatimonadales bacterium]MBP6571173.1 transcription-repair coupling factor [Gemmatimonadales bacterium]
MSLRPILDAFDRCATVRALAERLPARGKAVRLGGLPGSSGAVLATWLTERVGAGRLVVIMATTPSDAERWVTDLTALTGAGVALYPQREALGEDEPHYEIAGERIETLASLLRGELGVLVTTARASAERTAVPAALAAMRLQLVQGATEPMGTLVASLEAMGYRRVPTVAEVAEFSVRGGIVDLYGFGMASPARLEWWGDEIASLRAFDLTTQRSGAELPDLTVLPISSAAMRNPAFDTGPVERKSLLDLLPSDALLIEDASHPDEEEVERAWREAEHHLEIARRLGEETPPRSDLFLDPAAWKTRRESFARLLLRDDPADVQLGFFPPERVDRDLGRLRGLLGHGTPTLILCDNEGQRERLDELLEENGFRPSGCTLVVGALDGGFVMPTLRVLTDHEIFRRARRLRRTRRYRQAAPNTVTGALSLGDYVVHLEHGIGVYRGIQTLTVDGGMIEVAILEYEGGDRLNVPLYRLDQVERYRAAGDDGDRPPPKIHRLGGTIWKKVREKTRHAIQAMAADLLDLYARRTVHAGYPAPPDTRWQRELESSFLYEDTPDQRKATEDIKRDMERPLPMDRLLVGDVGYGKTEVAVRAAFKAVQGGKQVAVLVPTTILAEQHFRTFADRLADYPVTVEALSRFRTAKEQKETVLKLAEGGLDIVIGTHRLLSKDVLFKDLGLLIVDEEHRFGVKHKERLKQLRLAVDVLTLTATPIPRTLHLSLAGLRDMTVIETPPRDRSPILTFVEPWDDGLLEEAMARELDRGGQVFVVHNRIETIETIAARIRALAPRATVAVGHGQMAADELEDVMQQFVVGKVDILVSTMIVESGLDVPNANTMIVHDAHRFGLAQLYQLRGRVGRSHRRAYCYLVVPDTIDSSAEERLKVLEHHTDLGAGYRIALKDLELRGAGNLLGSEQSGHAHAVGFDLYMRWLEETVTAMRGRGGGDAPQPPDVVLDVPAHLPDAFIPDDETKLDLYRRLARASAPGDIDELRAELRERFGPLPPEADALLDMGRLRAIGAVLGLQHVLVRGDEARLTFRQGATPRMAGLTQALDDVQLAAEVRRTVPLSLRLVRLGGEGLVPSLVRALRQVAV